MAASADHTEERLLSELVQELEAMTDNPAALEVFTQIAMKAMTGIAPLPDDEETRCHLMGLRRYPVEETRLSRYPRSLLVDSVSGTNKAPLNFMLTLLVPRWTVENAKRHNLGYASRTEDGFNLDRKIKDGDKWTQVTAGSMAQGFSVPKLVQRKQGRTKDQISSDLDVIFVRDEPLGSCTTFDTTSTFPGYLRLRHNSTRCDCELQWALHKGESDGFIDGDILPRLEDADTHTERVYTSTVSMDGKTIQEMQCHVNFTKSGPSRAATGEIKHGNKRLSFINIDEVYALGSPAWPVAACGWVHRQKPSGWPSDALVTEITSRGCQVVPVAHCTSTAPEIEWRFSFTAAEKSLALSMTACQRQTFLVFKLLVSYVIAPFQVVSTFCLKNIMFWAMEKLPRDSWDDPLDGTAVCFIYLLDQLILCLAEHNVPHYFIPENNLLERKGKRFVLDVAKRVVHLRKNLVEICLGYNVNLWLPSFLDLDEDFLKSPADLSRSPQWRNQIWRVKFDTQLLLALNFGMRCYTDDFEGMYDTNPGLVEDLLQHDVRNSNVALQCGVCWCFIVVFVKRNIFSKQRTRAVHYLNDGLQKLNGQLKILHLVYYASYLMLYGLAEDATSLLREALVLANQISDDFFCVVIPCHCWKS